MEPHGPAASLVSSGRGHRAKKTLTLGFLETSPALPQASSAESLMAKPGRRGGGVAPSGSGRMAKTHPVPSCPSRSRLHLSRHRQPSTSPPGSLSPGQAPQQKARPEAPGRPRSRDPPGVRRAAWPGPEQTCLAQVRIARALPSLGAGAARAVPSREGGLPALSLGMDLHPMVSTFSGRAWRPRLPSLSLALTLHRD